MTQLLKCHFPVHVMLLQRGGGLHYKRRMGCAAGWGRIFITGLTIMGSHIFRFLGVRQFIFTVSKRTRMFVL